MNNKIQINEQELVVKDYENQRVVTMWDISKLHGVTTNNIRMNFKNNQKYLIEGEDYFLIEKQSDFVSNLIVKEELTRNTVNRAKDIPVFTESGYLLMTKPMTDEISWKVQRELINYYFKAKEDIKVKTISEVSTKYSLDEINRTLEIVTNMYSKIGVNEEEIINTTKSILSNAGIELPEIKKSKDNVKDYLTLEELATRIGIYTPNWLPNKQGVVIILSLINIPYSLLHKIIVVSKETNKETYEITYNPKIIEKISKFLMQNNYPEYLEQVSRSGEVVRCRALYGCNN